MSWTIYNKTGQIAKCKIHQLEYNGEFMGECSVVCTIKSESPIEFAIGDYLIYRGERFEINYDPTILKKASKNSTGDAFTYDNVKFNSLSDELARCDFLDYVPNDNNIHFTSLPKFSFFASSISNLAERIQVNLDRIYTGNKKWTVIVHPEYVNKKNINISVDTINVWDALALTNSEFEANFIIRGREITIGTAGIAVDNIFKYGKGKGLYEIERNAEADQKIVTRLRAYGSTRNMPDRYYNKLSGSSVGNYLPNNMAVDNLMLPGFPETTLDPYIDSDNIEELGIREGTIFFDGSQEGLEEIFPSIEGMTAQQLEDAGITVSIDPGDNGNLDEVYSAEQLTDDGQADNKGEIEKGNFTVTLKDIGFDINNYLLGETATLSMKDGMCGGRDFEITKCEKHGNKYILTCTRVYDDGIKLFFPYKNYNIKSGDKFVLLDISMPDVYIKAHSQRLLSSAKKWLAKNDYIRYSYIPKVDNIYMARQHDDAVANNQTSIHDTIKEGDLMLFEDDDLGISGSIIIDSLSIKEGDDMIPEYEITLKEEKIVGTLEKIQNQIDSIVSGGQGNGGYNSEQIKSLIKAFGSNFFLRKDKDDRTPHKLSSDKAFEVGQFVSGILGSGARINKDGYGEMNGLTLREFLEVPELRFNRIDVVSGELWNSIAFGLIKSVDTEKRIVELKLEDGERSGLHVNDICRGIFSNFGNGTQSSGTDECGFQQLYGFSTAYFTPTEIIENKAGVFRFRYALKSGTTMHPCASMKFAVYGNFIDSSRQASAYSTRTYKRYLNKVNTWVIDPDKNIYAQYGDLEGLVIGGMTMHGYGSFQSNSYFTGVQIQFTPEQKDELKGEDAYGVNLSNYEDVVTVDDEGNIIGGLTDLMNVVSAGRNVVAAGQNVVTEEYRLRTHVQAFKGSKELFYSPVFADGGYVLSLRAVGCTAMVASGVVVVTSITDMNNCYVDISVNCEGNALFQKTYTVKVVRNGRSPITADIDNEMASVACDQNGKVLLGLPVETKVSIWYGTQPLKIDKIDLSAPAGVTASGDASTGTVRVTGITDAAEDTLPIGIVVHATYAGDQYKKSLLFTVNKVKAGENAVIYQLQPSVNSVKVDEEGNYTDASVYCKVTVTDGKTVSELDGLPSGFSMKYSSDGGPESDYNYGSSISFAGKNKSVKFFLYKGGTLVDRETIPVVVDGRSVVVADLDNEMDGVSCDQNGKVVAGLPVQTVVRMYAGTKRLALTSISLTTPTGVTASYVLSSGLVNVTAIADSAADVLPIAITVKATWGGTVYTRSLTFTVNKVKQGDSAVIYNLLPSATVVKKSNTGVYTPVSVNCILRKTDGKANSTNVSSLPGGYTMKYSVDGGSEASYTIGSNISVSSASVSLSFSLYYNGTLVDRETIPVVVDGINGKPGEDGKPGDNAYYYSISPAQMAIGQKITGSLDPSSFVCTCYKNGSNSQVTETAQWYIYRSNDNKTWVQYASSSSYSATYTVSVSSSYKFYKIVAKPFSNIECVAYAQIVSDGEDGDRGPQGPQGPAGDRGPSGSMPRYRGTYKSSETYVYNSEYRDIVIYNGNAYIVKPYGYSGSATPTNTSYWEQSNKFSFVAMDTALIDGANIAGFMFKNQKMQSQSGTLTLDGINGSIDARKGTIGGFTLSNNSLSTTGSNASIKFEIDGYNFLRLNDTSSSAFLTARADGKTAASFSTYGTNNSSVALNLICNAAGYGYALKSNGNVEMTARSGETVRVNGLSLAFRRIGAGDSTTITSADNIVHLAVTSDITLTLNSNCPYGHVVFIIKSGTSKLTLYSSAGFYDQDNNNKGTSWTLASQEKSRIFVRGNPGWREFYCGA